MTGTQYCSQLNYIEKLIAENYLQNTRNKFIGTKFFSPKFNKQKHDN